MNDIIIDLVSVEYGKNEKNQQIEIGGTRKEVFATQRSIYANEFFKAGQAGLKPKYVVEIWNSEYNGETIVEVDGKTYTVYRTFVRPDEKIELYLTEKSGALVKKI